MSRIKILLDVISDVRHLADSLETYANALVISENYDDYEEICTAQVNPCPDEPVKTYEFTDVRAVLAEISQAGKTNEVKKLLQKYGVTQLSKVKPEDYPSLMKDAEDIKNAG